MQHKRQLVVEGHALCVGSGFVEPDNGYRLAAQPKGTAVCLLRWGDGPPVVVALSGGRAGDGTELHTKWLSTTAYGLPRQLRRPITKVGIDAPFGSRMPSSTLWAPIVTVRRWPTSDGQPSRRLPTTRHRPGGSRPIRKVATVCYVGQDRGHRDAVPSLDRYRGARWGRRRRTRGDWAVLRGISGSRAALLDRWFARWFDAARELQGERRGG